MQHLRLTLCFCLALLWLPLAWAAPSVKTVTVTANGKTQAIAIANALAQAVQQINGVQVDVASEVTEQETRIVMDWFGNRIVLEGGTVDKGHVKTHSTGPVHSYRVQDSRALLEQSLWQVTLDVDVVQYQPLQPERSHLRTLAVTPFVSNVSQFDTMQGSRPAQEITAELSRQIRNDVVQSGRFRVLDRDFWPQMAVEDSIVRNYSQATQEYIKQGQKLGADILLTGTISRFDISKRSQKIYDSHSTLYHADFQIDAQLVETATGEILWSDRIRRVLTHQQLRQQLQLKLQPLQGQHRELVEDEIQQQLYAQVAADISTALVTHFYPVRVLDTNGTDEVYLTQGDGLLSVGDKLVIHAAEHSMNDPDTGLVIKRSGSSVATVEVTDVQSYYASAKLVEGNIAQIQPEALARKQPEVPLAEQAVPSARPLTPGSSEKPLRWP